jgi:quercetin dioxygenase-like cupin family protein
VKIVRSSERRSEQGTTFTGKVTLERALQAQQEGGVVLSVVHFDDGARTNWHEHGGEQVLYILEGEGRVGTETEQHVVAPGDVIHATPGERHWHGAAPGRSMSHISITTGGAATWYGPPEE